MAPRREFFPNPSDDLHYYGTGSYGTGGAGFNGGVGETDATGERQLADDLSHDASPSRLERGRGATPRFGRGPKNYQRSDARIQEDISERLLHAYHIDSSEVTVAVDGGRVTFEGTVPDRAMKHQIEDLADRCPGVQDIQNRVRVASRGDPE